ncbi:MAG: class I SAM-dependent methyltransferase [Desulfobulbaceae bacterium]|nr:class I SAM-dependent methyltransferase [Desulfobulbaceae bacterium]
MAKKKIKGSEYGLENGTLILDFLFKSKYIHYGYFPEDLEKEFWNFGKAQEEYTKNLISKIPAGVKTILDVGCGTGMVAKHLVASGYQVECISPSAFLKKKALENEPSLYVYECMFEDFVPTKKYDMLLFCESYQYIKLGDLFAKLSECLAPGGFMMLCDKFKTNKNEKGPIGGGHLYEEHLSKCKENGLTMVTDQDITKNIAPTFDLLQDMSLNLFKPLFDNIMRIMSVNHPFIYKVLTWKMKKKIEEIDERLTRTNRNGQGFMDYNTYRLQVWEKKAS